MKKMLYYTVEIETYDDGSPNGNKTITVYTIENNEPKVFTVIDAVTEDRSEAKIQEYLDDNGHGDETFEFKWL